MRPSLLSMLAFAVVGVAAVFIGQVPMGDKTVGAHVVSKTRAFIGWVGRETERSSDRIRRAAPPRADALLGTQSKVDSSDADLVTESDRRSLMRLLE